MSDAPQLTVDLRHVLYRTRGHDWDYAFLLQPEPLLGEGWYALHRRIFANVEPTALPVLLRGELGIGTGQPFFASAFTDPVRRDYQDRAIAHYLTWFGEAAEAAPGWSFGPGLVAALSPALDAVFGLSPARLVRGETRPLDTLLRSRFLATLPRPDYAVACTSAGSVRWLGTIAP